jgi:hypothetical protein|tara:strand:- start:10 stop:618 length:609 start_codon:yes stop_codon:yes gene_type:complete
MKSIGFFGDSFCAGNRDDSWCNILAEKLGADRPRWFGKSGASIWSVFFKYNDLIKKGKVPDISIFCWTEPYRLHHEKHTLTLNVEPDPEADPNMYKALDDYWIHLQHQYKDEMSYEYALKYYDRHVLSKVKSQVVQTWSFKPFETADRPQGFQLETGTFIDESMFEFSKSAGVKDGWGIGTINHMTVEQNQQWADRVYSSMH